MLFEFDNALVREPGESVIRGLSSRTDPRPSYASVAREHAAYVAALKDCGLVVEVLPPLEEFPDSVFVEDPALVLGNAAILLRPGAPSRLGEVTHLDEVLTRRFPRVLRIQEGFADGGDMLLTREGMLIGLSKRTNEAGAFELSKLLRQLGIASRIVNTPANTLHLKSDCSLVDGDCVLCTPELARSGLFEGYRTLTVPVHETAAANSLRLNDVVLVGEEFPATAELLHMNGYPVKSLPVKEIGLLDAGLSCMSLRWKAP
jgi:dimethylargininase